MQLCCGPCHRDRMTSTGSLTPCGHEQSTRPVDPGPTVASWSPRSGQSATDQAQRRTAASPEARVKHRPGPRSSPSTSRPCSSHAQGPSVQRRNRPTPDDEAAHAPRVSSVPSGAGPCHRSRTGARPPSRRPTPDQSAPRHSSRRVLSARLGHRATAYRSMLAARRPASSGGVAASHLEVPGRGVDGKWKLQTETLAIHEAPPRADK